MSHLTPYRTWEKCAAFGLTALALGFAATAFAPAVREQFEPANQWGQIRGYSVSARPEAPNTPPIAVAETCEIARWGERPWLRPGAPKDAAWSMRTRAALYHWGIPSDTAQEILDRIAAGRYQERVQIGNTRIHSKISNGYHGWFSTTYVSAKGVPTVCEAARAVFRSDETREPAALYHVGGFTVMVPDACGNVSLVQPIVSPTAQGVPLPRVLAPVVPYAAPPGGVATPRAPAVVPGPWPMPPGATPIVGTPAVPVNRTQHVPEPPAILLSLAALAAVALTRRK